MVIVSMFTEKKKSNAGLQLRRAISIPAKGTDYLRRMLSRRQLQGFVRRRSFISGKHPILVRRFFPTIEANQFFNVLLVSVPSDKTMYDDLALYFGDPITHVLQVGNDK